MKTALTAKTILGVVIALALFSVNAFGQEDTVCLEDVKYERVRIEKENYDEVHFRVAGALQIVATEEVTAIAHGDAPAAFLAAEQHRAASEWAEAVGSYRKSLQSARKPWVRAYSQFHIAECSRMWGGEKSEVAVAEYEKFLDEFEKHRFVPYATLGLALAAGNIKQWKKQERAYNELADGRYGTKWGIRGRLGLAKASVRKGEPASSESLEALVRDARREKMGRAAAEAMLLLGGVFEAQKRLKQAAEIYRGLLESPGDAPPAVLAQACNRLGNYCEKSATGTDDFKKALFYYLRVVVLYACVRDQYPEAVKSAIVILRKMGGSENERRAEELSREYEKIRKAAER